MLATVASAVVHGVEGRPVTVEVHVSNGLPGFTVVGLPDTACRESRDRVRSAVLSSSIAWPMRKMTANLAPSGLRKQGAGLDLAIAVGVLAANGDVPAEAVAGIGFLGELGLDGSVRAVAGTLALAAAVPAPVVVVAASAAAEADLVPGRQVRPVRTLAEVVAALNGDTPWPDPPAPTAPPPPLPGPDLADVRGQRVARFALEVAAAGGHHVLFVGPPGAGKTMLAARLPGLLPDLDDAEALEVTRVHSVAGVGVATGGLVRRPPFRAPHHGSSLPALVGGGSAWLRPGEVSLAHRGVLFLDELAEFPASVLDGLRQPLEDGVVRVCRAQATASFPARFLLVAATNPCPCGGDGPPGACRCGDAARARYARRLSGPLLDRFDLRVEVGRPATAELLGGPPGETSAVVARRVAAVRALAVDRGVRSNAAIQATRLDELAGLTPTAAELVAASLRAGSLSARGLHRVRRVARTIADLAGRSGPVEADDVALALQLRADRAVLGGLS